MIDLRIGDYREALQDVECDALQVGKAGEYFVCFDLVSQGYTAYLSEQGLNYDVVVDLGHRLIKVQVKATQNYRMLPNRKDKANAYCFNCRRCGAGGRKSYQDNDFDIIALVSLKEKVAAYLPFSEVRQTLIFRSPELRGTYIDEKQIEDRDKILELRKEGKTHKQISGIVGKSHSSVRHIATRKIKPKSYLYIDEFPFFDAIKGFSNDRS